MKDIHISIFHTWTHFWGLWEHFVSKSEGKSISDICQFWCTTGLFESVKVHQRLRKIATKSQQYSQNCAFSMLNSTPAWKKFTSLLVPGVTNISYKQIFFTFSSPLFLKTTTNKQDMKHWANSSKKFFTRRKCFKKNIFVHQLCIISMCAGDGKYKFFFWIIKRKKSTSPQKERLSVYRLLLSKISVCYKTSYISLIVRNCICFCIWLVN